MELLLAVLIGVGIGWFVGRRSGGAAPTFTPSDTTQISAAKEALDERLADRHARIMEKARADGRITNDGVEELFCISDRTASVYLRQLTEKGELVRQGEGRGTFYTPTSN
jgi:predicted HTH transcriptional regulator